MKVILSGGEKGTYRSILTSNGVRNIALNVTQFSIPKTKEVNLKELLGGADIYLYASEGDEDVHRYDEFVRTHFHDVTAVLGMGTWDGSWLGEKYIPIWSDPEDLERLAVLCEKVGRVAISDKAITAKTLPRIRQLHQRWGTALFGITSKPDTIVSLPFTGVIVSSWTSVVRYGETQVWDGHGLRRYPAQQKESARKKHRADILRLNVDFDAVLEDDVSEVSKLAVRSWLEWEMRTFAGAYDPSDIDDEDEWEAPEERKVVATLQESPSTPNPAPGGVGIAINTPERRHESERQLIPVLGIETLVSPGTPTGENPGDGYEVAPETVPLVRLSGSTVRQCDSCYLARNCPGFKEHAECAYSLPIELRTKDQLQAALRAIIEMQMSRVVFGKFAEDLDGQGADPALSSEMDRLFNLVERFKNISDTRDLIRFEMEAKGGAGVLSRLFGEKVGEQVRALDVQLDTPALDRVVQDIVDGEVLD